MIDSIYTERLRYTPKQRIDIPNTSGVYIFTRVGESLPHYIGKSIKLKERVHQHFQLAVKDRKEKRITDNVDQIDIIQTPGEMSALLLESRLVKKLLPLMNRQLRKRQTVVSWKYYTNAHPLLDLVTFDEQKFKPDQNCYGMFKSKRQAINVLTWLAKTYQLCLKELGLEKSSRCCFAYQLKQCRGVCVDEEPRTTHTERVLEALKHYQHHHWPYKRSVYVKEGDVMHNINRWHYCGTHQHPLEPQAFCADEYRILYRALQGDFRNVVAEVE